MKQLLLLFLFSINLIYSQNWTTSNTNQSDLIKEVSVVNDDVIWIMDQTTSNGFSTSTDGGVTWTLKNFPSEFTDNNYSTGVLSAVDENTAYIIVSSDANQVAKGLYKTIDAGITWIRESSIFNDAFSFPNQVHFWDANHGFAMGDGLELYVYIDGSWFNQSSTLSSVGTWSLNSSFNLKVVGNSAYFITGAGTIVKTPDMGTTWTEISTPYNSQSNLNFAFKDDLNGILVYNDNSINDIYSTSDGGQTWDTVGSDIPNLYNRIYYLPSLGMYVSTSTNSANNILGLSYSDDNGITWTLDTQLSDVFIGEIESSSSGKIFAGGWPDMYYQTPQVNIPDNNFENYLETHNANGDVVAIGDASSMGDGVLNNLTLKSKVEGVTNLNVNDSNIASLQGIEAFVNLQILFCQRNQLESLDVSQNLALEELECESNPFTSLDVSSNTALKVLGCSDNNLSSLDVSNNLLLEKIWFTNNNITILNLDVNTALNVYGLSNNPLTFMSIKNGNNANVIYMEALNLPTLGCIQVDDENASYLSSWNVDSSITFSEDCGTVYIPDSNFENYLETHNANGDVVSLGDATSMGDGVVNNLTLKSKVDTITNLNVNDSNIASLQGIEAFVNLKILFCQRNQLQSLDVSQNLALEELECESNPFTSLDVSSNTALKVLGCSDNNLSSLDVSNNLLLEKLWFTNNNITSLNLDVNTALNVYGLSNNPLVYMSMKNGNNANVIYIEAQNLPTLTCIQVDDENAAYLSQNNWFVDPSISFNDDCGTVYIPDSNFENYLESHNANGDVVSLGDVTSMGDGVINNLTLKSKVDTIANLNVNDSNIASLQGLEAFTNLESLFCQGNQLESLDVSQNLALEELECESNLFDSLDVSNNTALKVLGCASNNLSELDVSQNLLLEKIWFTDNNISNLNLDVNTSLNVYGLSNNPLVNISIKNGNNANMQYIAAQGLPSLTCIRVDDENASYLSQNNWDVDPSITFSNDCGDFWTVYTSDANVDAVLSSYGSAIDTSGDGEITLNEAAAYTGTLDLSNQGIIDIEGLQAFTSVTEINLSGNNVLDLSVLFGSNAVVLTNRQAQFKMVSTSSFSGLLTLDVSNNSLKSLDVSSITTLVNLNCSNNALQRLNLKNTNNTNFTSLIATGNADLYCIVVDDPVYASSNFTNIDSQSNFSDSNCNATLVSKVFFQGPYDASTGLMKDILRNNGLIPTSSPYADGKTTVSTVLDETGNDAIIDWAWVEIRNGTDGITVLESSSALIQADGDIVDADGISPLEFTMPVGSYYVMVSHRNHLGVLTNGAAALSGITMDSDLTSDSNSVTGGINAIKDLGNGKFALFAGDFNGDGQVQNTDKNAVEPLRGLSGYNNADVDMNGEVQNTDLNSVLSPNIGKGQQFMSKKLNAKRKNKKNKLI